MKNRRFIEPSVFYVLYITLRPWVDHRQLIDRVTAVAARLDKRILAIVPQTEVVGRADLGVVRERQLTVFRNDRLKRGVVIVCAASLRQRVGRLFGGHIAALPAAGTQSEQHCKDHQRSKLFNFRASMTEVCTNYIICMRQKQCNSCNMLSKDTLREPSAQSRVRWKRALRGDRGTA